MRAADAVLQRLSGERPETRLDAVPLGPAILALAIPPLFLHVMYQPGVVLHVGSTSVDAYLSDWAVLVVVVAAAVRGARDGFDVLRRGRWLWAVGVLFFVWALIELAHGRQLSAQYAWQTHLVTAAKFGEYALLAPSVPLLVRGLSELRVFLWALVTWDAAASLAGLAQFFGADVFGGGAAGHRQASFLGSEDFAALSGAVLIVGIAALVLPRLGLGRRLAATALATGVVGVIVAGSMASILGLVISLVTLAAFLLARGEIAPRRIAVATAAALLVGAGAVAIRGTDLEAFAHFVGASTAKPKPAAKIQTYAHRTLLAWIGLQIWKDQPLLGVGWQGSTEPASFEPHLAAAHRRFPDESPLAFPAPSPPTRRYGVQDVWIQALADLGVVGLVLWIGVFAAAAWLALRGSLRGSPAGTVALLWTGLLVGLWSGQGFIAGIPLDAVTWFGFGLAATRVTS